MAAIVGVGAGLTLYFRQEKQKMMEGTLQCRPLQALTLVLAKTRKTNREAGKAAIGGPFELINQDGKVHVTCISASLLPALDHFRRGLARQLGFAVFRIYVLSGYLPRRVG